MSACDCCGQRPGLYVASDGEAMLCGQCADELANAAADTYFAEVRAANGGVSRGIIYSRAEAAEIADMLDQLDEPRVTGLKPSGRVSMMHPDEGDNWGSFAALQCDHCQRPIPLSRHHDFMLRYWAVGATPANMQDALEQHTCRGGTNAG